MDTLLAVGQANGKVTLVTFGPTKYDSLGLTGLEFSKYNVANYIVTCVWFILET